MDTYPAALISRFFILPDDGLEALLAPLSSASQSIDIYVYKFSNQQLMDELRGAAGNGVRVRALVDRAPSGDSDAAHAAYYALRQMGAEVRWAPPYFVKSHAKSYVVDGRIAMVSSFNFIADWQGVRDHGIISEDPAVVCGLSATFEADWAGRLPVAIPPLPLVLSPHNSRTTVLGLIDSAQQEILIEHQQFTDNAVAERLAARCRAGVNISIVTRAGESKNKPLLERLRKLAPGIRLAQPSRTDIHTKLLIVDRRIMLLGSINLTAESLDSRREVGLLVADGAALDRAYRYWQQDFAAGR